jgi:hypothetical protein
VAVYTPRAARYTLSLSVFYRATGDSSWSEARTENISESGVLLRGDRLLPSDTPVEFVVNIPANVPAPFWGTLLCRGRVVRAASSPPSDNRHAFAVTLLEYDTTQLIPPPH